MGSLCSTTSGRAAATAAASAAGKALRGIQPNVAPAPGTTAKTTVMPPPTNDSSITMDVRAVTFPLFGQAVPAHTEVKQSPHLANCPVAAILAAFAFTHAVNAQGNNFIRDMVSETSAAVITDVSGLPPDTLTNPPPGGKVSSSRYFTVKLPDGTVEVSDVLYTDDADAGFSLIYMSDPNDLSLWAAVIEKALAVQLLSYENFDALNLTANDFWKKISGVNPGGFEVNAGTPLNQITAAATASVTVPTIGASKDDDSGVPSVTPFHGYTMMGMQGSRIKLYDPAKVETILLSPADFRRAFKAILFRI